ncbi:MAG TPA: glucose-1-phosphate cytidylyltransferase [Pseudomonas xinjiangensis]|uniref:Glucose-1-phosphate cytidylyltransferase n=2 Tax=root TaxID=1 RepID=A0A7V1BPH0_9GAMM|nr:glucose-1-phosphate cytidylyltransferase [Halopseudomonas xinjiangensis]HEC48132.1 glucose-1-phosphate cytidylyltransferase [Halopseudomonas xinjiangensis]
MKVAIFAGGFGTRLSEETAIRPKPMVEVAGKPIIWHIMKMYAHHGFSEFVVLGGYKVDYIRDYFLNYRGKRSDYTIDLGTGAVEWHDEAKENWKITVLDTGGDTMTGGRLKRAQKHLSDGPFCLTYGDGVSDVDITALVEAHRQSRAWCTLTAVTQPGRYGALRLNASLSQVEGFREKGAKDGGLINGGFFVCEPEVFDLIDDDQTVWENEPMERMVERGKLASFAHEGYWQSMDSLRDKVVLEEAWAKGAPWKLWKD